MPRRRHLPLLPSLCLCLLLAPAIVHAASFDQHAFTPSHDTFVQRANPTSTAGSGSEFLVKRDWATASGGSDRLGYLRFTTAAPYSVVDSASLHITINQYPGNGSTPFTFELFGLPDGHANESFNESQLTFNTATIRKSSAACSAAPMPISMPSTSTARSFPPASSPAFMTISPAPRPRLFSASSSSFTPA